MTRPNSDGRCKSCIARPDCPNGWERLSEGKHCYRLFQEKKSWKHAEIFCNSQGGHLFYYFTYFAYFIKSMFYSMIQLKWNKVNSYISALKPLPRLPNSSKWPQLWDILTFETSGTSRSTGKCQRYHMRLPEIGGNWRGNDYQTPSEPPLHPPTPPKHPQISPHTPMSPLTYPRNCQRQP